MARRASRLTFRLSLQELAAIKSFADERHVIPSVAIRWLLTMGLQKPLRPTIMANQKLS